MDLVVLSLKQETYTTPELTHQNSIKSLPSAAYSRVTVYNPQPAAPHVLDDEKSRILGQLANVLNNAMRKRQAEMHSSDNSEAPNEVSCKLPNQMGLRDGSRLLSACKLRNYMRDGYAAIWLHREVVTQGDGRPHLL
ncbi:hypothetical protein TNCV_603511 [Trichonephila clavipes]|nr:hypothetical protein TNCV_603511 [Trichonephila clavipes]